MPQSRHVGHCNKPLLANSDKVVVSEAQSTIDITLAEATMCTTSLFSSSAVCYHSMGNWKLFKIGYNIQRILFIYL